MTELQSFNVVDKDYEDCFKEIDIGDIELEEVKSVSEIKDSILVADLNTI